MFNPLSTKNESESSYIANSVDPDNATLDEPPNLHIHCLPSSL